MFLAASFEKVRARIWEGSMFGRGLASVRACEDQLGGLCVFDGFKLAQF